MTQSKPQNAIFVVVLVDGELEKEAFTFATSTTRGELISSCGLSADGKYENRRLGIL